VAESRDKNKAIKKKHEWRGRTEWNDKGMERRKAKAGHQQTFSTPK